jgi:hypothetical protein
MNGVFCLYVIFPNYIINYVYLVFEISDRRSGCTLLQVVNYQIFNNNMQQL